MKILTVIGTRPEAIKMAPIIKALRHEPGVDHQVCLTAQHRGLLDQVMSLFGLSADFDLDLMRPNQQLSDLTARALTALSSLMVEVKPDWVLVQGDTTTVLAASLAAFYAGARVGHVEAGLRSFNMRQPFPEEANRRLASVLTAAHFAPTERSRQNLLREGVEDASIFVTGNSVIDALYEVVDKPYIESDGPLGAIPTGRRLILVTCHRRENFGEPLRQIFAALRDVVAAVPDVQLVYPVHPNPNVREIAHEMLGNCERTTLTDPLDYLPLVHLLKRAHLVITDSGGIQEEAPGFGKPVLVLRDVTERPEAVDAGTVRLVGADRQRIIASALELLRDRAAYDRMARAVNPYGDGHAAERIVAAILGRPFTPFNPVLAELEYECGSGKPALRDA